MLYIVAFCVACLVGAIASNLINYKATTDQRLGNLVGLVIGIILFVYIISDAGSAQVIRILAKFSIHI